MARTIAIALVIVLWHPFLAERTVFGQGRALTVAPTTLNGVRDWDLTINSMVRTNELRVRQARADTLVVGRSIERLAQYYRGVRVWGGDVSRQLDGPSAVSVFGTVYEGLDFDVTPMLDRDTAVMRFESVGGPLLTPSTEPELVILPDAGGAFTLTWMATVRTRTDVVRFFIDATNGQVLRRSGRLQRQAANAAVGIGYGILGDPKKVSATSVGGTFIASDPLRPPQIVTYDLRGNIDRAVAIIFANTLPLSTADIAANGTNNWTDSSVVDAHVYAGYTYDYYYKRFGRRGLDDANRSIQSIVHSARRLDIFDAYSYVPDFYFNAFYCAECADGVMVFGEGAPPGLHLADGTRLDFFAGALDVVAHELTHGVTNFSSQLEYLNEPGALNEAFSDMMGTSAEFFFQKPGSGQLQADYLIGEDIATCCTWDFGQQDGIRSMADPASFNQPDHYSKRVVLPPTSEGDWGGVHVNSGIPNQAFYLAIEGGTNRTSGIRVQGVGASNREQVEKVFYRAFVQLMPSNANFSMARAVTLRAAEDLYGLSSATYTAVRDAWTAVGVN